MAVIKILRMGHPILAQVAAPVDLFPSQELEQLVGDLWDTMRALDGAGLAAPQIGVGLRVIVFEVADNPRYPDAETVPPTVLVNPHIEALGERMESDWEGCLSIPEMCGRVPRFQHIRYCGYGIDGAPIEREVSGFHARVVQHECDHLDGLLYPQRIPELRDFGFCEEIEACSSGE